jgi:hypothetical protein
MGGVYGSVIQNGIPLKKFLEKKGIVVGKEYSEDRLGIFENIECRLENESKDECGDGAIETSKKILNALNEEFGDKWEVYCIDDEVSGTEYAGEIIIEFADESLWKKMPTELNKKMQEKGWECEWISWAEYI